MRTGIFGGSFDPPHKGHINMAIAAKNELSLDKVIIVPTGQAPHKPDISASAQDREQMCRAICEKYEFELSQYEVKKEGKCYTADLLEHFASLYPDDEFFLIVGADSMDYMDKWYKPEEIFSRCTVVVARRSGTSDQKAELLRKNFGAKIDFLNCECFDVSSTEIRNAILSGDNISRLVDDETAEYIRRNNLYR